MHETHANKRRTERLFTRAAAMLLVIVLLLQMLAVGSAAAIWGNAPVTGATDDKTSAPVYSIDGIGDLTSDEAIAALKRDLIKSFNRDLISRIDEYSLTGPVGVILTFSDDSLISTYSASDYADRMTYGAYRTTSEAKRLQSRMLANQNSVLDRLMDAELIDEVEYNYVHIMDAAYVSTTYESLAAIAEVEGVGRVMISNTYLPQAAVNNPVDVYETGIFNSGSVSYTGKGTLVAVLDTGCDYAHSAFTSYAVQGASFDRDDIAEVLDQLRAYELSGGLEAREVYYGNITSGKIAYGYDYADKDPDIMPFENAHGTHVAGIIAGKDDTITGVAIDAQLAIMKVFSDYEQGAEEGDILAALEDSVILGVDAINMSLGSSCGYSYESAPDKQFKNEVYASIERAGISLVVAASNDYSSGYGSEDGDTNKTTNPDSATVGSPSTYDAAMSVASINGNKDFYMLANGTTEVFFNEARDTSGDEYSFFEMLGIKSGEKVSYEYVTVPGYGMAINYSGIDVNGKIALVKRGEISFEEKVQYAREAGAIAVVIYNNVFGSIYMTVGNDATIPAVSIGKDDGDILASVPSGTIEFDLGNVAGPFMSDFSSWGPNPDLTLKPEITAHGGNIVSAVVGGEYDKNSGTSMAAPNMCGITVLIRQYVKENFAGLTDTEIRDMVNQLCMSTATIALDKKGNAYSPRKQGAGIADIRKATTTGAYLYVDGIGKTKLELGDDPERTGVYTMTVYLANISDSAVSYKLGNITMTESVSTSDPEYVAEIAYLLDNTSSYSVEGGTLTGGVVSVEAGGTAKITATITLSAKDKSYLNSTFENGMYVEGFLTFDNTDENGVDLNAPFLAFYGDWGEAPIFDLDYYEVETEAHNDAIDDDDKIKADYYATTPTGSYYYDYIIPLGTYLYDMDESLYNEIPATMDKAAVSYYADAISGIYGVFTGLLRGAKELKITMRNASTGEVIWEETQYNCYKAHFNGSPFPYIADMRIPTVNTETGEIMGSNNQKIEVTMSAKLDWDGGENISDSYAFSFYIDYQPPTVTDASYRTEYDKSLKKNRYYLDMWVYDNHYAMSCRPVVVYDSTELTDEGEYKKTYSSLADTPIPIYQDTRGGVTKVSMEITDYLDLIADSTMPNGVTVYIDDYALNSSVSYIPFPGTEKEYEGDIEFVDDGILDVDINQTVDLTKLLVSKNTALTLESDYLKTLKWELAEDNGVVKMKDGQLEALKTGTAVITVTSDSWVETVGTGDAAVNVPIYKTLVVNVSDTVITDNPLSSGKVQIEELKFSHYETLFAFNSDIDYSEIGVTGSTNYFGGNYSVSCYPSEQIKLAYELKPWNLDPSRYELAWSSSNPLAATVDENGVVTAVAEGRARITLNIKVDGKTSILAARLSVEVKSEFIIENGTLVAYKGKGGDVVIPENEGILYIGSYAFSHFDLDNEKEVEKDEEGNYDMDDKKTALGNDTVTSVVIPDGVETIQKYAFYGCTKLGSVTLPESCETIGAYAFTNCAVLENVNFDNVKIVSDYAFSGCASLSCSELGGANLEKLYAIGAYGFEGTRFDSVKLTRLSRVGEGAFFGCSKLSEVELGERTRVSVGMFAGSAVKEITVWSDTVSDAAFSECEKLESVVFKNDLTYLGDSAFYGCKELSSVTFEAGVETIAPLAFVGCTSLDELTLPDSAVAIGDSAFSGSGLQKLVFAENTVITTLGMAVLDGISGLTVDLSASDNYKLEGGAVYSADGKTLVLVIPSNSVTEFTVPAEVTVIGDGAFSSLTRLRTVKLEDGSALTKIGDCAFAGCTSLSSVALPAHALEIGDYAFWQTTALRAIDLSGVTSVGSYAFYQSGIESASLTADGVKIGEFAFNETSRLTTVTIGADAVIGACSFYESAVQSVELEGDATLGMGAFYLCQSLVSFDFADLTGAIPDYAFYGCVYLAEVNAPHVTEIGESAFGECYSLASLSADSVVAIGAGAFSTMSESATYANLLTEVSFPVLERLGEGAFYFNTNLLTVEIPSVKEIGYASFYYCLSMTSITLSSELRDISDYAFFGCIALKDFDFSSVVTIGEAAFYGVPLPAHLSLPNAESIGKYAFFFAESDNEAYTVENNLESVDAPKLTLVDEQAFAMCSKLVSFSAPSLREIGIAAFLGTAIEEFEVSAALESVGLSAFEGCESLTAFFATVNGEKVYDADLGTVMLDDGALYIAKRGGWSLCYYPAAKVTENLVVAEGTVRIDAGAVMGNTHIKTVVLPSTLKTIGNFAFYGCESLEKVVFKSYYAPVLEGTMSGEAIEITNGNLADYPGFDVLYKYDYFFRLINEVAQPLYYSTFKGAIGSKAAAGLVAELPDNCEGYDTLLYKAYFDISEQTSGVTMGKHAIAFIDAMLNLPESIDRFDRLAVEEAILTYNALCGHADEMPYVSEELLERYAAAVVAYNVDVAESKIARLFDMDRSKYSFDKVKDARATYLALTDEERALVTNSDRLDSKIAELNSKFGTEIDFELDYEDYTVSDDTQSDPDLVPPADGGGLEAWAIVLIVVGSAAILAAAAVFIIIFIRKKKSAK